jgi:hypothetical protein
MALAHGGRDTHGARVIHEELRSRDVGRTLAQALVVPRGGSRGRPLLVLLHWRGGSPDMLLSSQLLAALARLGDRARELAPVEPHRCHETCQELAGSRPAYEPGGR